MADRGPTGYQAALRTTLRATAAAYGYTLTIATTATMLTSVRGKPATGDLFLFVGGGLLAFAILDGLLELGRGDSTAQAEAAFPFAGTLNLLAVGTGLGAAVGIAHAVHAEIVWLLTPLAATAAYLLAVAGQVKAVAARGR